MARKRYAALLAPCLSLRCLTHNRNTYATAACIATVYAFRRARLNDPVLRAGHRASSFNPHSLRVETMRTLVSPLLRIFSIWIEILRLKLNFLKIIFHLVFHGISKWNLQISLQTEVEVKDFRVELTIFEKKLRRISHPFRSGPQVSSFCVHISGCCRNPCPASIRFEQSVFSESIAFYASRQCGFRLLSLCYNDSHVS